MFKKMFAIVCLVTSFGCSEEKRVDNYQHGVVLCDSKSIIINLGHEEDPEIKELFAKAKECSNYN